MARVLRLPAEGRLIVCTDLQGCLTDFLRVVDVFMEAWNQSNANAHLLITGDLIHGPHWERHEWPEFLGEYYRDASGEVIDAMLQLSRQYSGHIHALLGNHEHGHIGGPHTAKLAADEVALLEQILGEQRTERMKTWFRQLPIAAIAPCGIVFTHGAPAAEISSVRDIEQADLDTAEGETPSEVLITPILGPLLWARSASATVAKKFLRALDSHIAVFGHDVVAEGFRRIGDEQIIVSTSFGVTNANKVYLDLDLSRDYRQVSDLRVGHEILPLYPSEAHQSRHPRHVTKGY